jgi:hypothetical protein
MTPMPSGTTDTWSVVSYEAQMLFDLSRFLGNDAFNQNAEFVRNALVESTCLHTRILVDILLSRKTHWPDDIKLAGLLPTFPHTSIEKLRATYGDEKTEGSPCWTLNKMIAHPTLKRGMSHDYTDLLKSLVPLIEAVWQEIENHQRGDLSKLPKPAGGLDPMFCAKTSS